MHYQLATVAQSTKSTPTGTPAPTERQRNGVVPTAPSAESRRPAVPSAAGIPSAPRAQLTHVGGNAASGTDVASSTLVKQAIERFEPIAMTIVTLH